MTKREGHDADSARSQSRAIHQFLLPAIIGLDHGTCHISNYTFEILTFEYEESFLSPGFGRKPKNFLKFVDQIVLRKKVLLRNYVKRKVKILFHNFILAKYIKHHSFSHTILAQRKNIHLQGTLYIINF